MANAEHILVVDDDANTRRLLQAALEGRGFKVTLASDGAEALEMLRAEPFDVLISDLHMPRVDGGMVIEMAHSLQPNMGLILVTGYKTNTSVLHTFRHGLHAYLKKPLDLEDLYRAVESSLRARDEIHDSGEVSIQSPAEGWIEFSAPSHHAFVTRFENLFRMLFEGGVDQGVLDDLHIAITELGGNAVEWGNRENLDKPILIKAKRLDDKIMIMFKDEGEGFKLREVPDPTVDPIGVQVDRREAGKRPGGYGIVLVRQLVDQLLYSKEGNLVVIYKSCKPKEKKPDAAESSAGASVAEEKA